MITDNWVMVGNDNVLSTVTSRYRFRSRIQSQVSNFSLRVESK